MYDPLDLVESILGDKSRYNVLEGIVQQAAQGTENIDTGQQNCFLALILDNYDGTLVFPGVAGIVTGQKVEAFIPREGGTVVLLRAYGAGRLPTDYVARDCSVGIGR